MYPTYKPFGYLDRLSISHLLDCHFPPSIFHQYRSAAVPTVNRLRGRPIRVVQRSCPPCPVAGSTRLFSTAVTTSDFSFRIGAAFSAKNTRFNTKTDTFTFDSAVEDDNINTGRLRSGQDAFFITKIAHSSNIAFGVADGVGGWIESGIDSAHFSHGLCKHMAKAARGLEGSSNKIRARELLQGGYEGVVNDKSIVGGGSTACVAVAGSDGHLEVAK